MAKKVTRLHFKEEDLADKKVRRAATRADRLADKADKAREKIPTKTKLRIEQAGSSSRKAKLRFEKAEIEVEKPSRGKRMATHAPLTAASAQMHKNIAQYEDDNVGVEAVHQSEEAVETGAHVVNHAVYSKKLKTYEKAERLERKVDNANVEALYQKKVQQNPESASNPISRWRQKQAIKKEYAASKAAGNAGKAGKTAGKAKDAAKEAKGLAEKLTEFVAEHSKAFLIIGMLALLLMVVSGVFSSCSVMVPGGMQSIMGSSFTAKDEDIIGTNEDYSALENSLRSQIANIESSHPGYDEYRYHLDEINHNPYELTAYLTVLLEDYTRAEVQGILAQLYEKQYTLTLREEVEIRTRTETRTGTHSHTDPVTGETDEEEYEYEVEVEYEYYILHVTLVNRGLGNVIAQAGMTENQASRYAVLLETQGNRSYLFGDDIYATPGGDFPDYKIPGEALTDTRFAAMIQEAEKYLGYPYVWGGASPSTSFDCSGFVSWVVNHSGWNMGRCTANGLLQNCARVSRADAKPGDLIFFQGTYNTSGASHVGIYVGNNMMLHCGNPIQYASISTNYWQQHFYTFARLP